MKVEIRKAAVVVIEALGLGLTIGQALHWWENRDKLAELDERVALLETTVDVDRKLRYAAGFTAGTAAAERAEVEGNDIGTAKDSAAPGRKRPGRT